MPRWKSAIVQDIQVVSPTTSLFRLALPDELDFTFKAGQFITFDLPIGEKRLDRWRSYSIASAPSAKVLELCIVRVENGRASDFLFEEVEVGTTLTYKGPDGAFYMPQQLTVPSVFICTGTGVAPFISMLKDLDERKGFSQPIHLIFGTRIEAGILYRSYLEDLAQREPNFKYDICLSRAADSWTGHRGYVHEVYTSMYTGQASDIHFYLCGWSNMVDEAIKRLTEDMQVSERNIIQELYG